MLRTRIVWIVVFAGCLVIGIAVALSLWNKKEPVAQPRSAAVVEVTRQNLSSTLSIAGQFEPYQVVDLHAKVSGYIRWIKVDIGDLVHQGEVLADLEVPELQDQLQGAQADVQAYGIRDWASPKRGDQCAGDLLCPAPRLHAACASLAATSRVDCPAGTRRRAMRRTRRRKPRSASQRPRWMRRGSSWVSPRRTVIAISTLADYEQIVSPFTGVVTMRYADIGSLIQAGTTSNTQTMPVVQVSQSDLLRLRMPVPESDVPYIQLGGEVQIKVTCHGPHIHRKNCAIHSSAGSGNAGPCSQRWMFRIPDLVLSPGNVCRDHDPASTERQHADTARTGRGSERRPGLCAGGRLEQSRRETQSSHSAFRQRTRLEILSWPA